MEKEINVELKLTELLGLLWKQKIIISIITAITTLVIILMVIFIYNPTKTSYVSDFDLTFSGSEVDMYPNGEVFNFRDIVSLNNLQTVKNSNEKYSNIDINKIYRQNGIQITRTNIEKPSEYHLVLSGTRVNDAALMEEFVSDLLLLVVTRIEDTTKSMELLSEVEKFDSYDVYSSGIRYLSEQSKKIVANYEALIEKFGPNYVVDGVTLRSQLNNANAIIQSLYLNSLLSEAESARYVKNEEALKQYKITTKNRVSELLRLKHENDLMIAQYNSIGSGSINFTEQMEKIVIENAGIILEIESLLNNFDSTQNVYTFDDSDILDASIASEEYITRVNAASNQLKDLTRSLDKSTEHIYHSSIVLNYSLNSIVDKQGGINPIFAAVSGIILGIVFGSIVGLCIELPKRKKQQINA